jgi:SAM-dependent methyltransferase
VWPPGADRYPRGIDADGDHDDRVLREFARQATTFEDARLNFAFTAHLERLADFTQPRADDVCLDVAAGTGLVARALAPRVRHVTAVDLTPEMLRTGKQQADAERAYNVVFQTGDARALPFLDESFSLVVSRFSLHQVAEPDRLVREMLRVCRQGGRVVVADMVRGEQPGDPDRIERLRDPSHGAMLAVPAITSLLTSGGGAVVGRDVFDVPRPLRQWVQQAKTPPDSVARIESELVAELAGGPVTGMRPHQVDGELWFTQTWAHLRVDVPPAAG